VGREGQKAGTIMFEAADGGLATPVGIGEGGATRPIGANAVSIDTESLVYGSPRLCVATPQKYWDTSTSGLMADIKLGVNENVNFDLKNSSSTPRW
jgi:hypothetical protein